VQLLPDPDVIDAPRELLAEVRASDTVDRGFRYGLQFVDLDPELAGPAPGAPHARSSRSRR
jgi:hypothetical protein